MAAMLCTRSLHFYDSFPPLFFFSIAILDVPITGPNTALGPPLFPPVVWWPLFLASRDDRPHFSLFTFFRVRYFYVRKPIGAILFFFFFFLVFCLFFFFFFLLPFFLFFFLFFFFPFFCFSFFSFVGLFFSFFFFFFFFRIRLLRLFFCSRDRVLM